MKRWRHLGKLLSVVVVSASLGVSRPAVLPAEAAPLAPEVKAETKAESSQGSFIPIDEAVRTVRTLEEHLLPIPTDDGHGVAEPETRSAPQVVAPAAKPAFGPVYVEMSQRVAVRRGPSESGRGRLASRSGRPLGYERRVVPVDISPIILKHATLRNLDPHLVKAVIFAESRFRNSATSYCGAAGLMQLMPTTGRAMGARDLYDPEQNIAAGTRYLRILLDMYGGNVSAAIAAYNAGPGNVPKSGAIPNISETRGYVKKVLRAYHEYKREVSAGAED